MDTVRQGRLEVEEVIAERYEVIRCIASGGMGSVYLGRQLGLDRRIAIKVLLPEESDHEDVAALFRSEAEAIKHLTHPNTVRLYDFGETASGLLYLVMEYLEGEGLDVVLRKRGKLPPRMVVRIAEQVLKSLIEAHARGIVHRDIKPSNLMLCRQLGEPDFVKVLDFGIALHKFYALPPSADPVGEVMGTPRYMSPEQARGEEVDARSDFYSLGLTLYELVMGVPVFPQDRVSRVMTARLRTDAIEIPPLLAETRLGAVIARALSHSPGDRFPAAGDMLEALIAAPFAHSLDTTVRVPLDTAPNPLLSPDPEALERYALEPTLPRFPGLPLEEEASNTGADGAVTPSPRAGESLADQTTPEPVPKLVSPLVTPDEPREEGGVASDFQSAGPPPAPAWPHLDEQVITSDHPLAELVRTRIERRLRRRTWLTAVATLLAALVPAVLIWLGLR